jgi:hypothetical protein
VDDIAGAAGLVADTEFAVGAEALAAAAECGQIGREAIDVGGRSSAGREDGDRDGVLVHVEAEVDRWE